MATPSARYLIFDIESVADGDLIAKVRYPGEGLKPEEAIEKYEPGQQVSLKLYRRGQLVEVPVTLGEED